MERNPLLKVLKTQRERERERERKMSVFDDKKKVSLEKKTF